MTGVRDYCTLNTAEVVLPPGQSTAQDENEGRRIAAELLREFKIGPEDLIAEAYVDLLAGKTESAQLYPSEIE